MTPSIWGWMFTRQRSRWPFRILPASWRWKRYDDGEGQRATKEGEENEGFFAPLRMTAQGYNSGQQQHPTARQQATAKTRPKAKGNDNDYDHGERQRATREGEKNEGFFAPLRMTAKATTQATATPNGKATGNSKDKAKGKWAAPSNGPEKRYIRAALKAKPEGAIVAVMVN